MKLRIASSPEPRQLGATAFSRSVTVSPPVAQSLGGAIALPLQGPPGPAGPPGASGAGYVHTQAIASATWVINHNLGFYPSAALYDASGFAMQGDVRNVSVNIVEVAFIAPYAGSARLT